MTLEGNQPAKAPAVGECHEVIQPHDPKIQRKLSDTQKRVTHHHEISVRQTARKLDP